MCFCIDPSLFKQWVCLLFVYYPKAFCREGEIVTSKLQSHDWWNFLNKSRIYIPRIRTRLQEFVQIQLVMCTKQAEFWTSTIPVLGCHSHLHIYIGRTYSYTHSARWCPCPGCGSAMPCVGRWDPAGTGWNWLQLAVSGWDSPGRGSAVSCGGRLNPVGSSWNRLCLSGTAPASPHGAAAAAGACNGCSSWCWGVCLVQVADWVLGGSPKQKAVDCPPLGWQRAQGWVVPTRWIDTETQQEGELPNLLDYKGGKDDGEWTQRGRELKIQEERQDTLSDTVWE